MDAANVYWNVTRKCWSVRHRGRPVLHCWGLNVEGPVFHVGKSGRERVRRTGVKNVHAWVRGKPSTENPVCPRRVRYNPYENETFVYADTGGPCHQAAWAEFTADGKVYVSE